MTKFRDLLPALLCALVPFSAAAQTINGVVNDDHGLGLAKVTVAAYKADGTFVSGPTDSAGHYSLDLAAGSYRVLAYDLNGVYATGFSADAPSFEESPVTAVAAGKTVTVNLVLHVGGKVTGNVTTSGGTKAGLVAAAYNLSGTRRGFTTSDSTGAYSIVLPPGTYKMVAYDNDGAFAPSFFNNQQTFAAADLVTLGAQQTTGGVSFFLQLGARLAGLVTDTNGAAIPNAVVIAYNAAGIQITFAIAAADGTFAMTLPPGTYRFVAVDPAFVYAAAFLDNANSFDASPALALSGGVIRNDLVFRLQRGCNVAGTVIDATTAAALRNITVAAYNPDGSQRTFVTSDANGKYVLLLPPGSFRIAAFDPNLVYATQFSPQSTTFAHATPVSPTAGQTITLQPFTLSHGGRFKGTATDQTTGAAIGGIVIDAYDSAGNLTTTGTTAQNGSYALVVPPGSYRLIAFDPQLRYAPAFAGGVVTFNAITPASIGSDAEMPISFALRAGTVVSGSVVDRLHAPVSDVTITALDLNANPIANASSASDGSFRMSLVAGPYKFLVTDPNGRYAATYFGGTTFATATVVTVDPAGTRPFTLTVASQPKRRAVSPR